MYSSNSRYASYLAILMSSCWLCFSSLLMLPSFFLWILAFSFAFLACFSFFFFVSSSPCCFFQVCSVFLLSFSNSASFFIFSFSSSMAKLSSHVRNFAIGMDIFGGIGVLVMLVLATGCTRNSDSDGVNT